MSEYPHFSGSRKTCATKARARHQESGALSSVLPSGRPELGVTGPIPKTELGSISVEAIAMREFRCMRLVAVGTGTYLNVDELSPVESELTRGFVLGW